MAKGIVVCGLNGCGKSTLGRALAEKMGLYFIDNENLYFPETPPTSPMRIREPVLKRKRC
ncbi:MAG: shikimate kinase [Lachnospiraceae bacterium]